MSLISELREVYEPFTLHVDPKIWGLIIMFGAYFILLGLIMVFHTHGFSLASPADVIPSDHVWQVPHGSPVVDWTPEEGVHYGY